MRKTVLLFVASILLVSTNIQAQSKLLTKVISENILCGGDSTGKAVVSPNGENLLILIYGCPEETLQQAIRRWLLAHTL
jgi:hypothetical protein